MRKPIYVLTALALSAVAHAASADRCEPMPPTPCYSVDDCQPIFCLGPEIVNPAVRPCTCDGDLILSITGFYWSAHEDGLEYGIANCVAPPTPPVSSGDARVLNNLIDAHYETPDFSWDFGFRLGIGYNSNHDGWDFGVQWTWFCNTASDKIEAEPSDGQVLLPLWSAYADLFGDLAYASQIDSNWKLQLNLIDIELGREMWMSKYLTFRPFVGFRIAYITQDYDLEHRGGSFSSMITDVPDFFDSVGLDNDFKGIGLRSGFDTVWNFGRGWAFYGNFAANIVYGKFKLSHDEFIRALATISVGPPGTNLGDKTVVLETKENFRASRAMLDMALGFQWETLFSECRYCFTLRLGWENHLFFSQNQLWRVMRVGDTLVDSPEQVLNDTGENIFYQRRGDLDTQGITLSLTLGF